MRRYVVGRGIPEGERSELARSLAELASGLHELGYTSESVTSSRLAVQEIKLRQSDEIHGLKLAQAIVTYGRALWRSGRKRRALKALEEAVDTARRSLSPSAPAHDRAILAEILLLRARAEFLLKHPGESALSAISESVSIFRELSSAQPATYLPHLASALTTHAGILRSRGASDSGLPVIREAVRSYRQLATASREAFLPYLVAALQEMQATLGARLLLRRLRGEPRDLYGDPT
jgi:tetratricopeptide (TPR) repeat protein